MLHMRTFSTAGCVAALLAAAGWGAPVLAADYPPPQNEANIADPGLSSVMARDRPDYDPGGVRLGSFVFYPKLLTSISYDDNVTAVGSDPKADWIFVATPELQPGFGLDPAFALVRWLFRKRHVQQILQW